MSKKFDVVARVGEYQDQNGETKPRCQNVGAVIQTDNGHALLLNKTFTPAGLAEPGRESVILSLFEPRERNQQAPAQQAAPQSVPPQGGDGSDFDDDIPF